MQFVCFVICCAIVFIIWYVFSWIVEINDVAKPKKDVFSGGKAGDVIIEKSDGIKEEIKEGYGIQGGLWAENPYIETVTGRDENNNVIYSYVRERKNKEEKNMRKIKAGDKIKIISAQDEKLNYLGVIGNIYTVDCIKIEGSTGKSYAILKETTERPYIYNCKLVDEKEKQFTKSDLKNGDIVELRNGERYEYIEKYNDRFIYSTDSDEVIVNLKDGEYSRLANYDDDLRYKGRGNCEYDIMKILDMSEFYKKQKWTWEREKTEEMTLEEVCKELGKDIKIVKEH